MQMRREIEGNIDSVSDQLFGWRASLLVASGLLCGVVGLFGCNSDSVGDRSGDDRDASMQADVAPDTTDTDDGPCIVDQECPDNRVCKDGECVRPRGEHVSNEQYLDISAGHTHGCGVLVESKSIRCWGGSDMYRQELRNIPDDPRYSEVSASSMYDCALNQAGRARCWGLTDFGGRLEPPTDVVNLEEVATSAHHACAVHQDGHVVCWGKGSEPPSAGSEGFLDFDQSRPPEESTFVDVSAGYTHTCALREDGTIRCWGQGSDADEDNGSNDRDQAVPPEGEFVDLCSGRYRNCAIRKSDGSITCWGWLRYNTDEYPSGSFKEVSCGRRHQCALREDGTIACWGQPYADETTPPSGTFTTVAAGTHFSCALDESGQATCWGSNGFNKLEAP
jgi:alpha-tubulin suppressor-like RCC1 family protein